MCTGGNETQSARAEDVGGVALRPQKPSGLLGPGRPEQPPHTHARTQHTYTHARMHKHRYTRTRTHTHAHTLVEFMYLVFTRISGELPQATPVFVVVFV